MSPFLVYDIEAPGLFDDYFKKNATYIWCICAKDHTGDEFIFVKEDLIPFGSIWHPLSHFLDLVINGNYEALICHNQLDYDLRMINKFLGVEYTIKPDSFCGKEIEIIDTLLDSKWLNPKRQLPWGCPGSIKPANGGKSKIIGPHGLEAWGYRTAKKKPAIEDWENLPIEEYVNRCIEDVRINFNTFSALNDEIAHYFKGQKGLEYWKHNRTKAALPIYIEHGFKADIVEQRTNGVPLNKEKALALLPKFDAELSELRERVESNLPMIAIPPSRLIDWKFPAMPFKGDGTPSSALKKFCKKWDFYLTKDNSGKWEIHGEFEGQQVCYQTPFPEYLKTSEQMTIESEHLPQYIIDTYGWKPMYWNYKVDPKTKRKMRDDNNQLIPVSPRFKDAQTNRLCPHLESLEVDFIKDVLRYRTIKHRRSTIESLSSEDKGYLNHPRVDIDGRLPASMDTIGAATGRVTHSIVCNVPKADDDVLYGAELRDLFWNGGDQDWYFLGYDASGLEARLEGSEAYTYDSGEYARILLEEDIHTINAEFFGIKRGPAKNVKYALGYGAGKNKIATMLNISPEKAGLIIEDWWDKYWAVKRAIDKIVNTWKKSGKKFIYGIDGRPIPMESPHLALNYRLQNAGTVAMKLHACIMRQKVKELKQKGLVQKVIDYHDEAQWLVHKSLVHWKKCESEEEALKFKNEKFCSVPFEKNGVWWIGYCVVGKYGIQSITEAGERLGIKVPLTGEYKIGRSWKDCH